MNIIKILFILAVGMISSNAYTQQFSAFLFTKTEGFKHQSIPDGVVAMQQLSQTHQFHLEVSNDPAKFSAEFLKDIDVIIFLNTTGNILNDEQQSAMENFLAKGKGFVGIHSASDTEYDWPWYTQLVGRMFVTHPAIQTAEVFVEDSSFPGLSTWPQKHLFTDEWYHFSEEKSDSLQYILALNEKSYNPVVQLDGKKYDGMGGFHPIAWYQYIHGGRSFYTGLGHKKEVYENDLFLSHVYGGIYWAATGKGKSE